MTYVTKKDSQIAIVRGTLPAGRAGHITRRACEAYASHFVINTFLNNNNNKNH